MNLIFKSPRRLVKNSPLTEGYLMTKLETIQKELRHARQDNIDIKLMINKLLVDKHLQMQVDKYFDEDDEHADTTDLTSPQTDSDEQ